MTLDAATANALATVRTEVEQFVQSVPRQDEVENEIANAGQKFLAATDLVNVQGKLARKANPRRAHDPKIEEGFVTLRFRITLDQRDVVMAAIDKAIEQSGRDKGKAYKGWGLEMVCAEFLAGCGVLMGTKAPSLPSLADVGLDEISGGEEEGGAA